MTEYIYRVVDKDGQPFKVQRSFIEWEDVE